MGKSPFLMGKSPFPGAGTIDIKSSESVPLWPLCRAARNVPESGAAGAQVILERME